MPYALKFVNMKDDDDYCLSPRFTRKREAEAVLRDLRRVGRYCHLVLDNTSGNGQYQIVVVWTP